MCGRATPGGTEVAALQLQKAAPQLERGAPPQLPSRNSGADAIIISFIAFFTAYYCVTAIFPFVMNKFRLHAEKSQTMKKLRKRLSEDEKENSSEITSNDLILKPDSPCDDPYISEGGRVKTSVTVKRFKLKTQT